MELEINVIGWKINFLLSCHYGAGCMWCWFLFAVPVPSFQADPMCLVQREEEWRKVPETQRNSFCATRLEWLQFHCVDLASHSSELFKLLVDVCSVRAGHPKLVKRYDNSRS